MAQRRYRGKWVPMFSGVVRFSRERGEKNRWLVDEQDPDN